MHFLGQRCFAVIALYFGLNLGLARADDNDPSGKKLGHSPHGEAFDDGPRKLATIMGGMGSRPFDVTTSSAEAKTLIAQGVAQLHSFYYFEAERSFHTAAKIDPGCPMAYWGMALANINNPKRARGFLMAANAKTQDLEVTPRERAYLTAASLLFKEQGKNESEPHGFRGWASGLEEVIKLAPGDMDARAWLALALYQSDHLDSVRSVDIVLESVLRADPTHPGALHYGIHLWDGRDATQSLASAMGYGESAPGIAHAWHMPGHTYTALHRYADAARHQELAARVDHAAMGRDRTLPFEIHNYSHNNQWLCTSLNHVGRVRDAIEVARNLVDQPHDPEKNNAADAGSAQRLGRLRWAETLSRYELWDDLIKVVLSGDLDWSNEPTEQMLRSYSLGLAYAAKRDDSNLLTQIEILRNLIAERDRKLAEAKPKKLRFEVDPEQLKKVDQAEITKQVLAGLKSAAADVVTSSQTQGKSSSAEAATARPGQWGELTIEAALAELEGYHLLAEGDVATAFVQFSKTTAMRTEARSRAHLQVQNFAFAQTSAATGVERAPGEVPTLAAQVEIMAAVGNWEGLKSSYKQLQDLAMDADRDLPVFRRIDKLVRSVEGIKLGLGTATEGHERRSNFDRLGSLGYQASAAESFSLGDTDGRTVRPEDSRGHSLVVLFYLGGKCAHCMQQLQEFGKVTRTLHEAGTDIIAIGTDDAEATRQLKSNPDGIAFPMPMLADPSLATFKAYGAYDEFDDRPLHGIFLIDPVGRVHWRRISADPFMDVEFIRSEAKRIELRTKGAIEATVQVSAQAG